MKILHALVGYLAITALPFQVLAFPSELAAIDYDGYVNTTQNRIDGAFMKQALGTIVETCQTITSQNHKDSPLIKRVPGDIIESRQLAVAAPVVALVLVDVAAVVLSVLWIEDDDKKRKRFTVDSINKMTSRYPKFNWVICHSPYSVAFDGADGMDYGYTHHELKISYGRTIGYDLYWARSGTFYRYGDGGFINWAYGGKVVKTDNGGATVQFGKIS